MRIRTECLFATMEPYSTRPGAERAVREYQGICSDFGLTVSNPKTKHMVTGRQVVDSDREPIAVAGGEICSVGWVSNTRGSSTHSTTGVSGLSWESPKDNSGLNASLWQK